MATTTQVDDTIVGPIAPTTLLATAARYERSGLQFDYAIGGIPFVDASSDERPYARETAEFRKNQIDQSNVVGDQSLVGYWLRGQFSFHRGAGLKYYEVLELGSTSSVSRFADPIQNRFLTSRNMDPWTPGSVNLRANHPIVNANAGVDAVLFDGNILTLSAAGGAASVTYAGVATAKPSSNGSPFTSICSDGVNGYATNGAGIEHITPAGAFAVLWTHGTAGRTWDRVFWAKDRLWAVDNTGEWYTLSTAGGTTAPTDVLWTSRKTGRRWTLSDSEGGVFIGVDNVVFVSTLSTATTTPTLLVPVSVVTVGAQETISCIGTYLGYMVIATNAGVRLGQIGSGGVTTGNMVIEGDYSKLSRMSYRKNLIQFSGLRNGTITLFELNVLEHITDLQSAYAEALDLTTDTTAGHSSLVLPDGRTVTICVDGLAVDSATALAASGYLQTSNVRFGTLELKEYRSVTVRLTGTEGTCLVSVIKRDGTETTLITLGTANFGQNEIPLNLSGPAEFIGLKFTLAPGGSGKAPTLLGYQLRALPAPKRQRLIQIPMLCMDTETVRGVRVGYPGYARDRLNFLEALEQQSTVVQYQDFTIGESGPVSIEKIEFQRKHPATSKTQDLGGFLVLTVRTLY